MIQDVVGHGYVTTDTQLTLGRLIGIANELRGLPARAVQFIEIPTVPYPGNPLAWVQWAQPQAHALFAAIAHDTRLPSARRRARQSPGTANLARHYGGITGNVSICGDGGAFSGPDGNS